MYTYRATVLRVIDGDTLDVTVDLGFRVHHQIRVRLAGINCPELKTPDGQRAKQFVENWLAANLPVTLQTQLDKTEKYGRYLGRVITARGDLAIDLLAMGLANPAVY